MDMMIYKRETFENTCLAIEHAISRGDIDVSDLDPHVYPDDVDAIQKCVENEAEILHLSANKQFVIEFLPLKSYDPHNHEPIVIEAPYMTAAVDQNFFESAIWKANKALADKGFDQLKAWNEINPNHFRRVVQNRVGGFRHCVSLKPMDA